MEHIFMPSQFRKTLTIIVCVLLFVFIIILFISKLGVSKDVMIPDTSSQEKVKDYISDTYRFKSLSADVTYTQHSDYAPYNKLSLLRKDNRISLVVNGEIDNVNYIDIYTKPLDQTLSSAVAEQIIKKNSKLKNCVAMEGVSPSGVFIIDKRFDPKDEKNNGLGAANPFENTKYQQMSDFCYPPFQFPFQEDGIHKNHFFYYSHEQQAVPIAELSIKFIDGLREYKNTDLGISFMYPEEYGDIKISYSDVGPQKNIQIIGEGTDFQNKFYFAGVSRNYSGDVRESRGKDVKIFKGYSLVTDIPFGISYVNPNGVSFVYDNLCYPGESEFSRCGIQDKYYLNTKSKEYPGLVFFTPKGNIVSIKDIIDTIKFIN